MAYGKFIFFCHFRAKKSALQAVFRVFQNKSGRFAVAKFFLNFFCSIDPPGGVGPIVRSSLSSVKVTPYLGHPSVVV